jgi:nicotinate-nucleotide pyrophosphorylase (carboxylating)
MNEPAETFPYVEELIRIALDEDLREAGDVTSESIFKDETHVFKLVSKDEGILCGLEVFKMVMGRIDREISIKGYFSDGEIIKNRDLVAEVKGRVVSILKAERTALNFLSLLSAVSTKTAAFTREAEGRVVVLDTRKTIPGLRHLQKYAIRCGGGSNHRMGLHDMVMIKDNHIDAAGGITAAVQKVRHKWGNRFNIVVEARNLIEVKEALICKPDRILLDNMNETEMAEAVNLIGGACETEASGNITLGRIKAVSLTGVDFVSSGELTNNLKAFDFSLKDISLEDLHRGNQHP